MDLRKHTVTPTAHLKEGENPERDRRVILGTPKSDKVTLPTAQGQSSSVNAPASPVQSASAPVPPPVPVAPPAPAQSSSSRGGVQKAAVFQALRAQSAQVFPPQRFLALTDTMKMIILRQAAEEWGHSMPVASIYLSLSDAEVHILCDLEQEEKERREQWEEDVAAYTACGLEIASDITSKDITPQQGQHLDDLEKIQKDNLAEDAPSGYDVHPEDILAAQRFVRERVKDSPTRQAMLHGLKLHTGADYSRELLCSIKLGKLDSDDEN